MAAIGATALSATTTDEPTEAATDEQTATSTATPTSSPDDIADDYGDDRDSAQLIVSSRRGTIEVAGDEDWFSFDAAANRSYTFVAQLDGLDGVSLRLLDNSGNDISSDTGLASSDDARIRWETNSRVNSTHFLVVAGIDGATGAYALFVNSSSAATRTPTPVPTAVSASGTRWIAGTGGIGVKSRQDCTANADTSGSGLAQGTQVSLDLRGQARCDGWYRVNSAGWLIWVESKYLSTSEPTPVPQTGSGAAAPVITAICVDLGQDNSAECRASAVNGISLAQMDQYGLITWSIADDVDLTSYAVDGKVIDFHYEDFSVLALGPHTIQVYDPPGGEYEGWSTTISFTIVP